MEVRRQRRLSEGRGFRLIHDYERAIRCGLNGTWHSHVVASPTRAAPHLVPRRERHTQGLQRTKGQTQQRLLGTGEHAGCLAADHAAVDGQTGPRVPMDNTRCKHCWLVVPERRASIRPHLIRLPACSSAGPARAGLARPRREPMRRSNLRVLGRRTQSSREVIQGFVDE